jgi:L-ribulose-5-phosphate 3-epimerase UlaE
MATYLELYELTGNIQLRERLAVACVVAADQIRLEVDTVPNHVNRLAWAKRAFENPLNEATRMLPAILAQNRAATAAQIIGATDVDLQTAVNAAINIFAVA